MTIGQKSSRHVGKPSVRENRVRRLTEVSAMRVRLLVAGLVVSALISLVPVGDSSAVRLIQVSSSPAQGHAEVIAQGVITMETGNQIWRVTRESAPTKAKRENPKAPGFVLSIEGDILLIESVDEEMTRLAVGEAAFIHKGERQTRQTLQPQSTDYYLIEVAKASEGSDDDAAYQSESFASLAGFRDIDLVRDVLNEDETTTLPDSNAPMLLLATGGEVEIEVRGENQARTLAEGQAGTINGEASVTSKSPEGSTFVAAVIGQEVNVPLAQPTKTPVLQSTAVTQTTAVPQSTVIGQPTVVPEPTSPSQPTTPPQPTSPPPPADADGDGLSDSDEAIYGTDPNNVDTDGEGLSDGDEVHVHGTNPTSIDTDGDFYTDADEVNISFTDPTDPDTDDDGIIDSLEIPYGSNPNDPDTDDDGFNDGTEVASGTNPADSTSHP